MQSSAIDNLLPCYNIAPSQSIPVIYTSQESPSLALEFMQWGLIPSWGKTFKSSYNTINAKAETITEKPLYRSLISKKRCLIPADSFYEWQVGPSPKQPWRFLLQDEKVFALAGLWDEWVPADKSQHFKSFTIITTKTNELVDPIHNRMPVIMRPEYYKAWLDTSFENYMPL